MSSKEDLKREATVVRKSCCFFCHQNCGVLAYVKDGHVLAIEGDPEHPVSRGGLCARGIIALQHLNHPARINVPMKRVGERGAGKWEQVSWDQALDEIAVRLVSLKGKYGAETVATAGGTLRANDWARRRFMNLFGSPNGFHNAHLCWIPTFMIESAVYGWCPFEIDLANSRLIVLWGHNPGASGMPEMQGIADLKQNGLKVIVIDPRYTETASKADLWLPLRPGSDVALALAWLNVIIWEGLYDQTFIENCCVGFEDLAEHVRQYTPEWAAPLTWLDPELIRKGARMYANNRPGNIQWGVSIDQSGRSAGAGIHARALLRAVTGNLDAPGSDLLSGPNPDFITDEEMEANEWLPEEQKAKQIGSDRYKLITWPGYGRIAALTKEVWGKAPTAEWMCEAHPPSVFRAMLTEKPYPVEALIVLGTNPINSYGHTDLVLEALRKVGLLVTMEYWMTPTAMLSDYVLPSASPLERPTITTTYGCSDTLIASERAIQPMFERRTDYDFWRGLSLRMGQEEMWPWETLEEAFYYRIYPLGYEVSSYDEFVEKHRFHFPEREYYKYGRVGFATPSRRIELVSSTLQELGYPAMPTYVAPVENEIDDPDLAREFPLVLTSGSGFMPFHHSEHFQIKELRFLKHEPYVDINPQTAKELGISMGDWVWIETKRGRIKQKANLTQAVHPKVVVTQRGWWYPEREATEPELGGSLESNANVLTDVSDEACDPIGGSWANRGLLCRVYKVNQARADRR